MKKRVGIINYGLGNLRSVHNAISAVGGDPIISDNIQLLKTVDCLILPGVGAFAPAIYALQKRKLFDFLRDIDQRNTPLLGICLGMQLLSELSYEFGEHEGLGLISGHVKKISTINNNLPYTQFKLPNVGWYPLLNSNYSTSLSKSILQSIDNKAKFYFIHSFSYNFNASNITNYISIGKTNIAAIISRDNIIGTQFHPEKSGPQGLKLLKNFINIENSNLS